MSNLEVQTDSLEANDLLAQSQQDYSSEGNTTENATESLNNIEIPDTGSAVKETVKNTTKDNVNLASKEIEQIRIPSDPVEVMQILQVLDREKYGKLEKLVEEKENVRDAIEYVVDKIYKKQSGLSGLISAAFKGRKIPQDLAAQLDVLVEYEEELENFIDKMVNAIAKSRDLNEKSLINADHRNKLVLKQRAIMELENVVPSYDLDKYRKNCKEVEFFSHKNKQQNKQNKEKDTEV